MNQVAIANSISHTAHLGQYRRDGVTPYINHPMTVAAKVRHLGELYEAAALLHDVAEDSNISAADLINAGVDLAVVTAVIALTKIKGVSYDDYLVLVKANPIARRVKVADMIHNLSESPTDKQIAKYGKGLLFLID